MSCSASTSIYSEITYFPPEVFLYIHVMYFILVFHSPTFGKLLLYYYHCFCYYYWRGKIVTTQY